MGTTLTEQIASLNKRVTAVENSNLDSKETITRITKLYGNVKVTVSVSAKTHDYLFAGVAMPGNFTI